MFDTLIDWFRRRPAASPGHAESAAEMQHPLQRYYLGPKGEELPSAAGVRRRGETNKLPDGLTETRLYRLEEPEWLERRSLVGPWPYGTGPPPFRRTRYWPWGAERLRVAFSYDAEGQPQVEVHEYFPTGELRRHRQLTPGQRTTLYAFREPEEGEEYGYIEQMPQFPGGMEQLMRDISRFTVYPPAALREGLEGRVPLSFTVDPTGLMCDMEADGAAHPVLAAAAVQMLRQVAAIRRWQPGMQNRRTVPVVYTVPVTFSLR